MTQSTDLEAQGSLAPASLESVRNAFIEWRKAKNPGDKIPKRLWTMVRPLIGHYKISQVYQRLSINAAQLKQAGILTSSVTSLSDTDSFVNVELASLLPDTSNTAPLATTHPPQLILEREDGKRLIVNHPSTHQSALIIEQFWR